MTILKNCKKYRILKFYYKGFIKFESSINKNKFQNEWYSDKVAQELNLEIVETQNICYELYKENFLTMRFEDEDRRNHRYKITEDGINAHLRSLFIHRDLNILFKIFAVTIPLIISFISLFKNCNNEKAYETLNKRIDSLVYELKIKK